MEKRHPDETVLHNTYSTLLRSDVFYDRLTDALADTFDREHEAVEEELNQPQLCHDTDRTRPVKVATGRLTTDNQYLEYQLEFVEMSGVDMAMGYRLRSNQADAVGDVHDCLSQHDQFAPPPAVDHRH